MGSYYKILVIPQSACLSPSSGPSAAGCSPVADGCCTFRIKSAQNWKVALVFTMVFCSASLLLPLSALPNDTGDGEDWSASLRRCIAGAMCSVGQLSSASLCFPWASGTLKNSFKTLSQGAGGAVQVLNLVRKH